VRMMSTMNVSPLAQMRELLVAERHRLDAELAAVRDEVGATGSGGNLAAMERYGQDATELASDTVGREVDLSIEMDLTEQIHEIDAAIIRLDGGTYGNCEVCGRPISAERLAALPAARRCVADQETAEHFGARSGKLDVAAAVMEDAPTSDEDEDDLGLDRSAEESALHIERP
jgi:DnaK suppressor protein